MAPSDAINDVEIVLRDLVELVLAEKHGEEWIEQCGPPEKIEKWRRRKVDEAKKRDGTTTEQRLIYYSDFTDLGRLIKQHWELFEPCLGDRERFDVYMNRLEEFRNAPMHSRTLVPFERALAEGMAGEIRNKVTIYRSGLDPADRHFPRIEYVRDSFGNAPTGGSALDMLRTGVTLYPSDEVSFEGSGWDPQDGPLPPVAPRYRLRRPEKLHLHRATAVTPQTARSCGTSRDGFEVTPALDVSVRSIFRDFLLR
jgi:Swt1-like HEPN